MLRVYFGHHKAASTYVRTMLRDAAVGLRWEILTISAPVEWAEFGSLGGLAKAKKPGILSIGNSRQEDIESLPPMRAFHVIRDPRDIVISGYFHHMHSHAEVVNGLRWEELPPHRARLRSLDHDEGLLAQIEFSYPYISPMGTWNYEQPDVLEVRMEDLIVEPLKWWTQIWTHLDVLAREADRFAAPRRAATTWNLAVRRQRPAAMAFLRGKAHLPGIPMGQLPASWVPEAVEALSFKRLSGGRAPGEESEGHKFRKGVPGDWRNHFTAKHIKAFQDLHGDLVERLGYSW